MLIENAAKRRDNIKKPRKKKYKEKMVEKAR